MSELCFICCPRLRGKSFELHRGFSSQAHQGGSTDAFVSVILFGWSRRANCFHYSVQAGAKLNFAASKGRDWRLKKKKSKLQSRMATTGAAILVFTDGWSNIFFPPPRRLGEFVRPHADPWRALLSCSSISLRARRSRMMLFKVSFLHTPPSVSIFLKF